MADESLYVSYRNGEPYEYRYGEPWVAMQLLMEGGYPTPEEAKRKWQEWKRQRRADNGTTAD